MVVNSECICLQKVNITLKLVAYYYYYTEKSTKSKQKQLTDKEMIPSHQSSMLWINNCYNKTFRNNFYRNILILFVTVFAKVLNFTAKNKLRR